MTRLLLNIDVPDLDRATAFYCQALGLTLSRHLFGHQVAELSGAGIAIYLLHKPSGSMAAGAQQRDYARHWTPLHFDLVVHALEPAIQRALAAGALAESDVDTAGWGRSARFADPFGHGFCLIEFSAEGYASVASP
ncbi:putative glyoxalase superfamily protein PhnB [Tahibacter aquaticus]|uniref:Putative glyoxalase superfamily protein PhnB n=1 Tax=Tahibacter aquaticus TaxID=520092 RepID=A0A4R6YN67_9GAMM|nr:VOC family protein [Tahibacter aquaticus]TDR38970.1 putative glyoxalase superfamily protein PhnB [Tahibacter aquaticus]